MDFQDADSSMPAVIYEGYTFPNKYAVFGNAQLDDLNEDNAHAFVYIGSRNDIKNLMKEINNILKTHDYDSEEFIVVGLWDNPENDYIMLSTIICHHIDNPLEYINVPATIHQLTDSSTSDTDAWRAWGNLGNDYMYNSVSQEETKKVAQVLLQNISDNMINNFKQHVDDDFLKSLLPASRKLKL